MKKTSTQRGFPLGPWIKHKSHPNTCFQGGPLFSSEEKLKWLLSDSGRETGANDLAGVRTEKGKIL